ncbi:hypothetical protein QVD17_29367 [Tagetes erecta]|uniref:Reverse transcriptase zinc-binding domain-containing protein n=1 Tax=Tagetes erecta TaxID=13708 RepID=A0AAD8NTD1_TARER|nr:hypothetical protein QVD17_29367 [Tagetes erecta]
MFKAPSKVINELEAIRRKFLWEGNAERRRSHWRLKPILAQDLRDLEDSLSDYIFRDGDDGWIWHGECSGLFSTWSSRMQLRKAHISIPCDSISWLRWIPPNVLTFIWKVDLDRIPVSSSLIQRGVLNIAPNCFFGFLCLFFCIPSLAFC